MNNDGFDTLYECEFCGKSDTWPIVFKAGPYRTHEPCLIKAVEEGRRPKP